LELSTMPEPAANHDLTEEEWETFVAALEQ
jgi:hypothetical protein